LIALQQARAADRERRSFRAEQAALALARARLDQLGRVNDLLAAIFRGLDVKAAEQQGKPLAAALADQLDRAAAQVGGEAIGDPLTVARLQDPLGISLTNLGYPAKAVAVLAKAVRTREAALGPGAHETNASRADLATAYSEAGRNDEAIELYQVA